MKLNGAAPLAALGATVLLTAASPAAAADRIPITTSSEEARKLFLEGRDLSEKLRATDARVLFEKAAAKDPGFALAQVGLANTAPNAKEFFAAVDKAVALAAKASEPERLLVCALDAGAKGEPARQQDCLTKLVAAVPDDERAHNQMGAFHFGRQDYEAAVMAYRKATAINPRFSQPYNQLGYAYRFMGRYPEAEKAFRTYIEVLPGDPNPHDSYAELLMKLGRFEESIASYEKALAVDPNFIASYIGIGNNQVLLGQPEKARASYARLAAIARNDGERVQANFWTAMSYVHEGATDKALSELKKTAASHQARGDLAALAGTHNQMGNILLEAGRVDDAAARFGEQVATMDKAQVAAQVKAATRRQHLFDQARVALARNDVATAKARSAEYAKAIGELKVPFEIRQGHELAGRIALAEKSYAAAAEALRQANQQDPRVLYLLATALAGKGEAVEAKKTAVQAADWNALSNTYGYVRGKARAMATATASKQD
jgi:tetratricopeptide (TPR) repeat protein